MQSKYNTISFNIFFKLWIPLIVILFFCSCEKTLHINYDNTTIKQVINCNFTPNNYLKVNVSKSKLPNDFSSIEFLENGQVDLYEDGVFKETMPFKLKDTLSGLGYYTSSFKLMANKTYKIVSAQPNLPTAEATEYLPPYTEIVNFVLLQHADSLHPNIPGQYIVAFQDSTIQKNYYYLVTYYKVLRPTVSNTGDTTWEYATIYKSPSYTPDFPNNNNNNFIYFADNTFNGQVKTLNVTFPSMYNTLYKEIYLVVEIANTGENYYEWYLQHLKTGVDYLNQGQMERINPETNIINGFGHFSGSSSSYINTKIK